MKKFDLNLDTTDGSNPGAKPKPAGLGLDLGKVTNPDLTDKEKEYDDYNPLSSRKDKDNTAAQSSKPKFNINVGGLGGSGLEGNMMNREIPGTTKADGGGLGPITPVGGMSAYGITPNAAGGKTMAGFDTQSNASGAVSRMSHRYRAARAGAQIITPLGSDMSRAKFDFSGYDAEAHRKKKPQSPERKVIKKIEEDAEVFMSENVEAPEQTDLEFKNEGSSNQAKEKIFDQIYNIARQDSDANKNAERLVEIKNLKDNINEDEINAQQAYDFFNQQEYQAVQREQNLLDLQVGGQAQDDIVIRTVGDLENQTLPALKLERLATELSQLEVELKELEKWDIPGGYNEENDSKFHLQEIDFLREEMEKILGSQAFVSLEGKSSIQELLQKETQNNVNKALSDMIETKVTEYSSQEKVDQTDGGTLDIGDQIKLSFSDDNSHNYKNAKLSSDIVNRFQAVDQSIDKAEKMIGVWKPENQFMTLYSHLDELCDKIEDLDTRTMDIIGQRAKELNKDLEDIVRNLQSMNDVNYDKNKIDFLFSMLEKAIENEDHVRIIAERLRALEKIHKDSPNIESSIKALQERQKLIDLTFTHEDQEILKTKGIFMNSMQTVQHQLKEVTMLQKNKPIK